MAAAMIARELARVQIRTSSFFAPAGLAGPGRVSIARYAPRKIAPGYRVFRPLQPGAWFNSVSRAEYERLYAAQLAKLDPERVVHDLVALAAPHPVVLLCWESRAKIEAGETFCHRHLVSDFLERELGLQVVEL